MDAENGEQIGFRAAVHGGLVHDFLQALHQAEDLRAGIVLDMARNIVSHLRHIGQIVQRHAFPRVVLDELFHDGGGTAELQRRPP